MSIKLALPDLEAVKNRDLTFAVALGGGGARGIAHIQIIEALDELGIRPVAISGSSIGAIMGAGWAAGMSGREIRLCSGTRQRSRQAPQPALEPRSG